MSVYSVQAPSRRCSATDRELHEGEKIVSVLLEENGQFVRKDYAENAWKGAPEGAIAFWQSRIPTSKGTKRPTINDDMLMECLDRLADHVDPGQVRFRYVAALLLMRRRRLKFDEVTHLAGQDRMRLTCSKSGRKFDVIDPHLNESELESVQSEVFRILGWD
ncbi:hypothetical protein [Tuwongella immobilis]|uniref:Uncharacterized protein n=1 Tax=Tuwongella immobilis TaxID=692036 RepID=A0A6C2YPB1_9BACT|nr:hypothetical protein [Tuwongella immobilis]VIP02722.1 Uncharacterized protein OS=Planctomyces maris DSM 8797 GN=PM8797T_28819 PE=4 SV=1 [Tuwongella immobilis]VTS02257.1 Uncharacterized protein OS=Planctomyces maris DSM 8797 GN=PM8797T_28819 PE=4 SV=1 [Tuwongella immobilis]